MPDVPITPTPKIKIPEAAKKHVLSSLIDITFFWISEKNFEMSTISYKAVSKFPLSKKQKARMQEAKAYMASEFKSKKSKTEIVLYQDNLTEDENLICVAASFVLNLFAAGEFTLAFDFFFEIASQVPFIGDQIMYNLKREPLIKEDLKVFLGSYVLFYGELMDVDVTKGIDIREFLDDEDDGEDDDDDASL